MACERKCFFVKWRIEKFRSWLQKQESILYSPEFTVKTMEGTKWRLSISSQCEPTLRYIALSLLREVDEGPERIDLDFELSFLANDESPLKLERFTERFRNATSSQELMVKKDTVLVEKRYDFLNQENLTVSCRIWRNSSLLAKNERCLIRSVIGLERITLDGIIENFSNLNNLSYRTINFIMPSTGIFFVSLRTCLEDNGFFKFERMHLKSEFIFTGKLFIVDDTGNRRELEKSYSRSGYVPISALDKYYAFRLKSSIKELAVDNFLPNDILTLQYEVAICPGIELENVEYEFPQDDSGQEDLKGCNSAKHCETLNNIQFADKQLDAEEEQSKLMTSFKNDMMFLYNDHLFCDTLLQTGTETFPVHRAVLCARSPVFKKMFTTDMKENKGEPSIISDLSPDTLRRMLLFIYTDATDDLDWENTKELYFASDKYEILTLKRRCSLFFKQNLSPFNVTEILILADRHQDDELMSAVQDYILKYDQVVFSSEQWKGFMENYCNLAAQIMYMKCLKK